MAENNEDPIDLDALADELFGDHSSDAEAGEKETPAENLGESASPATQVVPTLDPNLVNQLVNQRLMEFAAEQERGARLSNIQKLLTEGDDEEAGKYIKAEYARAQLRSQYGDAAISDYSATILDQLLPDDYVAQLPVEDRQTLAVMAEQSRTDAEYFTRVSEWKHGKSTSQRDEEEFNKRVAEAVKAQNNQTKGQQLRSNSASNAPASKSGGSDSYDSDSIWNAAFEELASIR